METERIGRLVGAADLPSLLAALAHATGDASLAPEDLWLDPARALEPDGGWDEAQLSRARGLAVWGIQRCLTEAEQQAGGGDRHRGQRPAVHSPPGRGGGSPDRVPAHTPVADPPASLSRAAGAGAAEALRTRARLRPLVPIAPVLVHPRRNRRRPAARPGLDRPAGTGRQPPQRRGPATAHPVSRVPVRRPSRPAGPGGAELPGRGQAGGARQRHLGPHAQTARRGVGERSHRADRARRGAGIRRPALPSRRDRVRHRIPGFGVPHADERHRSERNRPARILERRRPRLQRHLRARIPQPVLRLRTQHQHRGQRQHHLLRRVRRALHRGVPAPTVNLGCRRHGLPTRRLRQLRRAHGGAQRADGLGDLAGEQLVQEPQRPGPSALSPCCAGRRPPRSPSAAECAAAPPARRDWPHARPGAGPAAPPAGR